MPISKEQIVKWLQEEGMDIDKIDYERIYLFVLKDLIPLFERIHFDGYAQGRHDALRGELPK